MRRQRKAYEAEVKKSQQVLKNVADETGGKMILPLNSQEMMAQANEVARAIGAEYVVTYRPKRPLAEAKPGEYRKHRSCVAPRRSQSPGPPRLRRASNTELVHKPVILSK